MDISHQAVQRYFVEVAVNIPRVTGVFHYHVPEELIGLIQPGCLVVVPFGAQRVQGVVLREIETPDVPATRPVEALLDARPVLTAAQMTLAKRLAEKTLSPLPACLDMMLPAGLSQHADTLYQVNTVVVNQTAFSPSELQTRLIELLSKRGELRGRQIDAALPRINWRPAAQTLVRQGLLLSQPVLMPPAVRPKFIRTAQINAVPERIESMSSSLGRPGSSAFERRKKVLEFLLREPWPVELPWVYAQTGGSLADMRKLAELDLVALSEAEVWRDPLNDIEVPFSETPILTQDQEGVWDQVQKALRDSTQGKKVKPLLLRGVTGSGKTEIYLRAVEETLRQGRQAIVLVPEIALTPQTIRRFLGRFPGRVGLLHSRLSPGERYDTWRRIRAGLLPVVVGPRSALFAPLPSLGLIVVDECHDESYYQSDIQPYYHAVSAAALYAELIKGVCLMGSATPDIVQTYLVREGRWKGLDLPLRILAHRKIIEKRMAEAGKLIPHPVVEGEAAMLELPPVRVIDMREELKSGNRSIFSRAVQEGLARVLNAGEQAILFLNRRGTATYVFCRECGHSLRCPRCDLPLTAHGASSSLICHQCGYRRKLPKVCPRCGSSAIRQYGTGTEKVEQEVQSLFPKARVMRWDAETTRQKGSHDFILSHFANHQADILVGTQMLAKGLDFPLVTFVGVILADVGLNLPDFRASERTFQLLTQVSGRAGRSPLGGEVVLQTFQPDHYVIQAAAQHDFAGFYERELAYRRQLKYPPFSRLVRLEYRHANQQKAQTESNAVLKQLRTRMQDTDNQNIEIIGPVPCFFARVNGIYRWQIILRGHDPTGLLREHVLPDWHVEVDPPNLL